MTWTRRLASIAAILTLCVGNLAACAGWQATPEARMACCMNSMSCPTHNSGSHGAKSKPALSQVQANNCCAETSDRTTSSAACSIYAVVNAAAVPATSQFVVTVNVAALQAWRAPVPLPGSPIPKHLLLSVLLV